jgi:hypothetical protein
MNHMISRKIESLQDCIFICSGLNQCFVGEVIAFGTFSILLLVLFLCY